MALQLNNLAGALALAMSSAAFAQNTPPPPQGQPATTIPDEPGTPHSTAPGQSQTEPGQASQMTPPDTSEPSGQAVQEGNQLAKATAADVKAGVSVYDEKGGVVGKIVSSTAKTAVVDTGTTKASIPLSSIAKSDKGLVIGMTKAEIDAAAKKKKPGE